MYNCEYCNRGAIGTDKYCFKCDYCKVCCTCNVPKFFNSKLKFHSPKSSQKKINKSSRFISAEIEVDGIKNGKKAIEDVVRKWNGNIVRDGTLWQPGFEINTAPAAGDLYVRQITDICNKLTKAGAIVSNQCGLHVHIDARDYNYNDLKKLIKVYSAIEPTLFSMVSPHRRDSMYAIKCGERLENAVKFDSIPHIELKKNMALAVYTVADSISFKTHKRGAGTGTGRYYALNLHSWFYRGTIECRLFDGTIDKNEIIDWGILWANIIDFALHSSDDEILAAMNKNKSYESLIYIVNDNKRLKSFVSSRYDKYAKLKKLNKKEYNSVTAMQLWQLGQPL